MAPRGRITLVLILFCLVSMGCGYRLQTKADLPFTVISVGEITNKTYEPKLQDRFVVVFTQTLMEYGFTVTPSAEHRLTGSLNAFELRGIAEKGLTASNYQIMIRGDFTLTEPGGTSVVPLKNVQSLFITMFAASGALENVLAAKDAATDRALRDLSLELIERIIYTQKK